MDCYECNLLKSSRYFSDDPDKPYIIVTDRRVMTPVLVWREHIPASKIKNQKTPEIMGELKQIAESLYGENYLFKFSTGDEHFHVRIEPSSKTLSELVK